MWTCPKCGEAIEDQFDSCWKCASQRAAIPENIPKRLKKSVYFTAAIMAYDGVCHPVVRSHYSVGNELVAFRDINQRRYHRPGPGDACARRNHIRPIIAFHEIANAKSFRSGAVGIRMDLGGRHRLSEREIEMMVVPKHKLT
jgi:hypothetical protein